MYKRANTVYAILQHFLQKAYVPCNNPNFVKKNTLDDTYYSRKDTQLGSTYTYSKSIEERGGAAAVAMGLKGLMRGYVFRFVAGRVFLCPRGISFLTCLLVMKNLTWGHPAMPCDEQYWIRVMYFVPF